MLTKDKLKVDVPSITTVFECACGKLLLSEGVSGVAPYSCSVSAHRLFLELQHGYLY